MTRRLKTISLAFLCGTLLGGACLGLNARTVLTGSLLYVGLEYVTDGGLSDLIPSNTAAAS